MQLGATSNPSLGGGGPGGPSPLFFGTSAIKASVLLRLPHDPPPNQDFDDHLGGSRSVWRCNLVLPRRARSPPFQILFWVAILAGAELLPVSLGFGTEVTMAFPIHLALAITFRHQPWVAMAISWPRGSGPTENSERNCAPTRALLNRANMMLSVGAAVLPLAIISVNPLKEAPGLVLVILSGVLHLVTNLGIVTLVVHWEHGVPLRQALSNLLPRPVTGFAISYVVLTALGVITAWAYQNAGAWAVAAILIPLLFTASQHPWGAGTAGIIRTCSEAAGSLAPSHRTSLRGA